MNTYIEDKDDVVYQSLFKISLVDKGINVIKKYVLLRMVHSNLVPSMR